VESYSSGTIEIFIDDAVDTPGNTNATTAGFKVTTNWYSATVDDDSTATVDSTRKFTADAALVGTVTATSTSSLTFEPQTAGEFATYTFSFKSSVTFLATDMVVIVFPDEFCPFLGGGNDGHGGAAEWFANGLETDMYYVMASSTEMGTVWAKADHWEVWITGTNEITANSDITVTLMNIGNPPAAATSNFKIGHTDSSKSYKGYAKTFGTVTPTTALLTTMAIREVTVSNRFLWASGIDYSFEFYMPSVTAAMELRVMFPVQYSLRRCDGKASYTCETSYDIENTSATSNIDNQSWNTNTECLESSNMLSLAGSKATNFAGDNPVTLTIKDVGNPEWGNDRTKRAGMDWDINDPTVYHAYDTWTERFTLYLFDTTSATRTYVAKSYGVLNSAYLGMDYQYRRLVVMNESNVTYDPASMNGRITVYAGS
jgi:hypothetical protein